MLLVPAAVTTFVPTLAREPAASLGAFVEAGVRSFKAFGVSVLGALGTATRGDGPGWAVGLGAGTAGKDRGGKLEL